jgi:hypothetical protein
MELMICCIVGCELWEIPSSLAVTEGRRKRRGGLGWSMASWHAHGEKGQAAGRGKKRGGAGGVGRSGDFGLGV